MKREIRKVVQPLPSHVLPIDVGGECRKYIYKVHKDEVVMSKEKAGGAAAGPVKMAASMPNLPQSLPSHDLFVGVGGDVSVESNRLLH